MNYDTTLFKFIAGEKITADDKMMICFSSTLHDEKSNVIIQKTTCIFYQIVGIDHALHWDHPL
jgi:hypothetical protein